MTEEDLMKRIALVLLAVALMAVNDAALWAGTAQQSCPGPCPICP